MVPTLSAWQTYVQRYGNDDILTNNVPEEFSRWLEYDIKFALGTDAAEVPVGESYYRELQLLSEAGMSPYGALKTATINAAQHAEMETMLGTLESGKYADVVVSEKNPIKNIQGLKMPTMVFKKGKLITKR